MKVEIINKDECKELFMYWGLAAAKCYDTPKKFATRVGKSCLSTGHYSGSRGRFIMFDITGVPRALVDQLVRHEVGVFKNVESGRYVNFEEFEYYTPAIIDSDEKLSKLYHNHMKETRKTYKAIVERMNELGYKGEKCYEVARGIMCMNYNTGLVIGFTVEALINFMHKRLCVCAQDHIRKLAILMKKETLEVLPELESYLVAVCDAYQYCPESEKRTCGKYPQKDILMKMVKEYKTNIEFKKSINELGE